MTKWTPVRATLLALWVLAGGVAAQAEGLLPAFEKKVTEHRLANGWMFLIVENHDAPVVSFFTHVNVGAAQEVYGITGLAHMFEHMAFKGTDKLGTTDFVGETKAIDALESAFIALKTERTKVGGGDASKVAELDAAFKAAQEAASKFVVENAFGEVIDREGGTGLNAFTSSDETGYFFSLPVNKIELWAYLESERFLHPVFRDFYKERDVVKEERRMRTESQPIGRLIEEFIAAAFKAHPYGHPVIGHMSDLDSFTISDAKAFLRKHYVPSNMVTTIVGDVQPTTVIAMLESYFGRIPAGPAAESLRTVEPTQRSERRVSLFDDAQPFYVEGYHVPPTTHPDARALDVLAEVMGRGRTSRLYRDLVRDQQSVADVGVFTGFPGSRYPSLFTLYAVPTPGHGTKEIAASLATHIARLRTDLVSEQELAQVKSRAKADLVRRLSSAQGLTFQLGTYQATTGDWRNLFRDVERIDALTAEDLRRVAAEYLRPANRTVGVIVKDESEL